MHYVLNKYSLICLIALMASACAQTAPVTKNATASDSSMQASTTHHRGCIQQTGSLIAATEARKASRNNQPVQCSGQPGRSYDREDIERTGATNTADALRMLDPAIN